MPPKVIARLCVEPWDVERRLSELKLSKKGLMEVRAVAMHERANATPFHPANAAGTFAYQHGSWALRNEFVGVDWIEDRKDGVEAIRCDELKIRIAFSNVDQACDLDHDPKPKSNKGAGAERVSNAMLFEELPKYVPDLGEGWALYYVMLDERGALELSRPIVKGGSFVTPIERIFICNSDDGETDIDIDDQDDGEEFDPQIARK